MYLRCIDGELPFPTPGALVFAHGLPALGGTGQFLIKDVVLLGASVSIAGRALAALRRQS